MAGVASHSITFTGDLLNNVSEMPDKSKAAILAILEQEAEKLEQYMKQNRPWTDRTGNARAGLSAKAYNSGSSYMEILLSHSVYYGVYLEYAMEKRYAIIYPTILSQGPQVLAAFNDSMRRLCGR